MKGGSLPEVTSVIENAHIKRNNFIPIPTRKSLGKTGSEGDRAFKRHRRTCEFRKHLPGSVATLHL